MKRPVIIALHITYWCLYVALLSIVALIIKTGGPAQVLPGMSMAKFMLALAVIPGVAGFYSSYTFLFSEYLNRKKIPYLFAAGFAIACVSALIGVILLPFIFGSKIDAGTPLLMANDGDNLGSAMLIPLNAFVNGLVGLLMKGFITWYDGLKMKEEMDKKNFEMELALVKSQFNPHFLFNTINNIDVLIEKDAPRASAYLNSLSDMMRFMLYETKTEQILLTKELGYIEKYIDLQKIRSSNPNFIRYTLHGAPGTMMIAPMLFIPFIENAFKHVEQRRSENAIRIEISITTVGITFVCENYFNPSSGATTDYGGLGNELIQKRLQLLYGGRHELTISNADNMYKVTLTIDPYGH
jgi:two-component system LytT family sensor kinase